MRPTLGLTLLVALLVPEVSGDDRPTTPRRHPDAELIERYAGTEFTMSDEAASRPIREVLDRVSPGHSRRPGGFFGIDPSPAYVWKFGRVGEQSNCLICERTWTVSIPGTTTVRLTAVNSMGHLVSEAEFHLGGRTHLDVARLKPLTGFEFPVLDIQAHSWFGDTARQYYALVDGRFDLIRVEDNKGIASRNRQVGSGFAGCGPPPPEQSEKQWEADLLSSDRARVLRALVWMAGQNPGPLSPPRIRAQSAVAARLRDMVENGQTWEREAAKLALKPEGDR